MGSVDAVDGAPKTITRLLLEWRNGDAHAQKALVPMVYDEAENHLHLQKALMALTM